MQQRGGKEKIQRQEVIEGLTSTCFLPRLGANADSLFTWQQANLSRCRESTAVWLSSHAAPAGVEAGQGEVRRVTHSSCRPEPLWGEATNTQHKCSLCKYTHTSQLQGTVEQASPLLRTETPVSWMLKPEKPALLMARDCSFCHQAFVEWSHLVHGCVFNYAFACVAVGKTRRLHESGNQEKHLCLLDLLVLQ